MTRIPLTCEPARIRIWQVNERDAGVRVRQRPMRLEPFQALISTVPALPLEAPITRTLPRRARVGAASRGRGLSDATLGGSSGALIDSFSGAGDGAGAGTGVGSGAGVGVGVGVGVGEGAGTGAGCGSIRIVTSLWARALVALIVTMPPGGGVAGAE